MNGINPLGVCRYGLGRISVGDIPRDWRNKGASRENLPKMNRQRQRFVDTIDVSVASGRRSRPGLTE